MATRIKSWSKAALGMLCLLFLSFWVAVSFSGCMSLQMKESEVEAHFEERSQELPVYSELKDEEGSIFLVRAGQGPTVVFVHGSPGSWDNFVHMLSDKQLNSQFTVLSVDRPGFGKTRPKGAETSIKTQARRIRDALAASGAGLPAIWVGHSLGGPVVARLAVDFPADVSGMVLVAPSMDPELEKRKWFNWAGKFPLVRWGLSREWRNSNDEIWPLKGELIELEKELGVMQAPTIVLQGDLDQLVPVGNADYVERQFPEGVVELRILEGVNHFIPWSHPDEIKRAIFDLMEEI
ncbi:alpha/beta hydrolase [Pelagicoccus sp. SDUM812002]|uniref:alpha/beta fold hydrolase n=1 Tax=Pelagicoccus sp. SDUM812002 TaxID=3041266 RepID=UPI0028101663|nr:alpha/beta hydrolase [Pelagicoccus sp. SDUM812002]MDQ8185501.1 alpha/beta hydrolase [Pelagicoccus sp. SDUM812002]